MSVTVDANILVYASNEDDPVHRVAIDLMDRLARGPELVYLFWPVIMGYLRIATHPAILPAPLTFARASANVSALLRRPHVRTAGEGPAFWDLFLATAGPHPRGNAVPDAHLAGLMRQYEVTTIYTRDRDYHRFQGISVQDPFT